MDHPHPSNSGAREQRGSALEVLLVMARLGSVAFGGPVAHLAHYQAELIDKRKWLRDEDFAELIAFCQFLPGPASSQVGMGLGLMRAGLPGMLAAWIGFCSPSVVLLLIAAAGLSHATAGALGWLHGLLAGVVAIVADAVWKMARKLCPDVPRLSLAIAGAVLMLLQPHALMQLGVIGVGALTGLLFLKSPAESNGDAPPVTVSGAASAFGWGVLVLCVVLPVFWSKIWFAGEINLLTVYAAFAQTGTLVFGGGHVVLPMLQADVVAPGWMTAEQFLAGYGVTQAVPGPIFTLSAYLGATIGDNLGGSWANFFGFGAAALFGIFMPSFGFMAALYPLWHRLRAAARVRQALQGISAAVVGLLIAALYDPVWVKAVSGTAPRASVAVMLGSWLFLVVLKRPAWQVVGLAAASGALFGL